MKPDLQPVARLDGLVAVTVFLAALFLYVHTAAPGLLLGDSGELQTQAYALGHTHPTGYPVYVLAARTFTSLTWGDLAGRVNLFSAFCAAAGLAALYLCGRLLGGWRVAALIGPLALAPTPLYWMHAAIAELYAPAALLLAVVVCALLMARERKNPRWLMAAALVGGLSLGVHPTVALAAPAAALYVASLQLTGKWRAALGGSAIGVALALSAFFVIDLVNAPASYFNTVVGPSVSVWGLSPADLDQPWERLAFSIEARQFQRLMATDPTNSLSAQGPFYLETLRNMWPAAALVLALLGAAALLILQPREGLLWGVALLTQVAFVLNYGVSDIQVFYIPGYALIALAVSRGAAVIQEGLARAIRRERSPGAQQLAGFAGLAVALAVTWPSLPVVQQAWVEQQPPGLDELGFGDYPYPIHDPYGPQRDAQALVDAIEDDAIVFTGWDRLYPSVFVAHVLEGRSGIAFHEAQPQDGETGLADSTLAYIDSNWQTRPIYFLERPGPEVLARFQLERGDDLFKIVGERTP
jgi:hypothetical protein